MKHVKIVCTVSIAIAFSLLSLLPPSALAQDDRLRALAETLTSKAPETKEWKDAAAAVKQLSTTDQGRVGQLMNQRVIAQATTAVNFALTLHKLGATAGKNPIGKALGDAVKQAFGALGDILKDPMTKGGKDALRAELVQIGLSITDAVLVVDQVERRIIEDRRNAKPKPPQGKSSGRSVTFDADTNTLTFADDFIVGIEGQGADPSDPVIGSLVDLPTFVFDGPTPEGLVAFAAEGDGAFSIRAGPDIFLHGVMPFLTFEGNEFLGVATDLVLSGVDAGSLFFGDLPTLGSAYVGALDRALSEPAFTDFLLFTYTPDFDFFRLTEGFTVSAAASGTNSIGPGTVAEPATLALLAVAFAVWRGLGLLRSSRAGHLGRSERA
jgi:hypothetical protein